MSQASEIVASKGYKLKQFNTPELQTRLDELLQQKYPSFKSISIFSISVAWLKIPVWLVLTSVPATSCTPYGTGNHGCRPASRRRSWTVCRHATPPSDPGHQRGRTPAHTMEVLGRRTVWHDVKNNNIYAKKKELQQIILIIDKCIIFIIKASAFNVSNAFKICRHHNLSVTKIDDTHT